MHMQSLHLKITPHEQHPFQWNPDDLRILEQFFDVRVAAPPYRPSLLCGFCKTICLQPPLLKDAIQLMRLDLSPELLPGAKWHMQFCMRVPPTTSPPIVPVGNPGMLTSPQKCVLFVSIVLIRRQKVERR